jgi:heptosyltransferase III
MESLYTSLSGQKTVRILILRLKPVGDTILISPVFRNLKRLFPTAVIDVVVYPFVAGVVKNNPYVDNVIVLERTMTGQLGFYLRSLSRRYDVIIDYINNPVSTAIALFTRARYRIGNRTRRNFFYSHRLENKTLEYSAIRCLRALEPLGLTSFDDYRPELVIDRADQEAADRYIGETCGSSRRIVGIFCSAKYRERLYSPAYLARIGRMIAKNFPVTVMFLFGKDDIESYDTIRREAGNGEHIVITPTDVPLGQLCGLIARLSFFLTSEAGPKHIATAYDVPTLAIYKATNPRVWNFPDLDRYPAIVAQKTPGKNDLSVIDPEPSEVFAAFERTVKKLGW